MSDVAIGEVQSPKKPKSHDDIMSDAKEDLLKVFDGPNQTKSFSPKELYFKLAKYGQDMARAAIFNLISEDKICFDKHLKIVLSKSHHPISED